MAAPSSYIKSNKAGRFLIRDGTAGTPLAIDPVPFTRGDFALTDLREFLNEVVTVEARGQFISHHYGNRVFPQLSFSAFVGNVVGATAVAPGAWSELATRKGAYASAVPTLGTGRPMTVDLVFTFFGTRFGEASDETFTLEDVSMKFDFAEADDGNTLTVAGMVLGPVTVANGTNTVVYSQIAA
jgi:hypothetical protein